MKHKLTLRTLALPALLLATLIYPPATSLAQGTAFTYQGRLNDGANPANGTYDLRFQLNDAATGGNQWGQALTNRAVTVSNGLFTTTLDFGFGVLTGGPRWLQVSVRTNDGGGFVFLSPRTALLPAPYAVQSANAAQAETISGTVPASGLNGLYSNPVNFNNPASSFAGNGAGVTDVDAATLNGVSSAGFWKANGNTGANPTNGAFLGTTDNLPLELKVNNQRGLRLEPTVYGESINVIGGWTGNQVINGAMGVTIWGGGSGFLADYGNIVGGNYGTVSGGRQNSANSAETTVAGGRSNIASGWNATVSGGYANLASGNYATVVGGVGNQAGGKASVSAGTRAKALHDGAFVWADATDADFPSTAPNQFLIRAGGGVGINTTNPTAALEVRGTVIATSLDGNGVQGSAGVSGYCGVYGENLNGGGYGVAGVARGNGIAVLGVNIDTSGWAGNFDGNVRVTRKVGIGTTNPAAPLQIGDANTPNSQGMMRFASRSGTGGATRSWDIGVPEGDEDIGGKFYSFVIDDPAFNGTEPEFIIRWDTGNVGIGVTNPASKLHVNGTVTATAFNPPSDRNLKENFAPVSPREVLEKVAAMPISRWNFIGDTATPHVGPMAQDFHAAFRLGTDNKHIATVDADGVALAAIQGLNQKLETELQTRNAEVQELKLSLAELKQMVQTLVEQK